jgi:Putative metal-binding motif
MARSNAAGPALAVVWGLSCLAVGCAGILGVEDIQVDESGIAFEGSDVGVDAAGDMGANPPPLVIDCQLDADCTKLLPKTEPANCAKAACIAGRCAFVAIDADGDGARVKCRSTEAGKPVDQGTLVDCDDKNPGIVPGGETSCTDNSFTLPGKGACKAGKQRCNSDGTFSSCVGVVGKSAETCDNNLDEDCDGLADNGCGCTPGSNRPCGPDDPKGICKRGTQSCVAAKWSTSCEGAVFPNLRDCLSDKDNDCNGAIDRDEPACRCDGTVAGGTRRDCGTGQVGICADGSQTCTVGSGGAAWGGCAPKTPAQAANCASSADNNCNGLPDNQEASCSCDGSGVGAMRDCGTGQPGICAAGTQRCASNGGVTAWGTCTPKSPAAARDCISTSDNNCNGTADNAEAGCTCDGVGNGGTGACLTGLSGICSAGTRVCSVTAAGGAWGVCNQTTAAATRRCSSLDDNDCNGSVDRNESVCMCGNFHVGDSTGQGCAPKSGEPTEKTCEPRNNGTTAAWGPCVIP